MDYLIFIEHHAGVIEKDSLKKKEGFPHQRLTVVPANVIRRCRLLPVVSTIYVTDIGSYSSARHHFVERTQWGEQAILIYCVSGKGSLQIDKTIHPVHTGHLLLIPPGIPHIYQANEMDPWSILWVHFSGEKTRALLAGTGATAARPLLYIPDTRRMRDAFEDLYACLNYHYSDAGLLAMTGELLRLLSLAKLHRSFPDIQRQSAEERVLLTRSFMERHLDMPLTLETLAAHSGQSVPYYSKLFKKQTSLSPMAWFIQLKIRKACELLDQTGASVREIAAALGYDDPYYFSRIFKKVQGCSPAAYRRTVKG